MFSRTDTKVINSCADCKHYDVPMYDEPCNKCENKNLFEPEYPEDLDDMEIEEPKTEEEHSNVDHPSHYNNGGMECIDEMVLVFGKEAVMNFCVCNCWKYRYRSANKNGQEDIAKSNWYMKKYKELSES